MNTQQQARKTRRPRAPRPQAHDFTAPVDITYSADYRHDSTGAIHTWQIVKYRDSQEWKARNATTRAHRATAGEQRTWAGPRPAMQDMDAHLEHVFFSRLTPWEPLNPRRIV